jgi:hypothetical protein
LSGVVLRAAVGVVIPIQNLPGASGHFVDVVGVPRSPSRSGNRAAPESSGFRRLTVLEGWWAQIDVVRDAVVLPIEVSAPMLLPALGARRALPGEGGISVAIGNE